MKRATTKIPTRFIAVAAAMAAEWCNEDAADAFDPDSTSRARWMAIESLRLAFPAYTQVSLAAHFGIEADSKVIARRMESARCGVWWNQFFVLDIVDTLRSLEAVLEERKALFHPCPPPEPFVDITSEERGSVFVPRKPAPVQKVRPVLATLRKINNVTSALLGDPPPGRREMLASMKDERGEHGKRGAYQWGYDR